MVLSELRSILNSTDSVSDEFNTSRPTKVFFDTYTDGWFVEYALETSNNWKRYHNRPLTEHGEGSYIIVCGGDGLKFRLNSGTVGATAYITIVEIAIWR